MIDRIVNFWRHSYETDSTSFWLEVVSFVFTVSASLTLAITAKQPDLTLVYPGFFVGSLTAVVAYYRRKLVWPLLLTAYFAVVNVFGFSRAIGWV